MAKLSLTERFWAKTRIAADCDCQLCDDTDELAAKCVIWTAAEKDKGYGAFWDGTRTRRAHQVSYELVIGPVPAGLQLDHLCRVRNCVAPAHLEAVTGEENRRRGLLGVLAGLEERPAARTRQRSRVRPQPRCHRGHELSPENTYREPPSASHPQGRRRCRICRRAQDRLRPSGGYRMRTRATATT